jgi:DNA-directed RNA polymerase specialized sigma24 family protein
MIAEILKVPLGTVKSRINSAQKQLKLSLGGENIV